MCEVVINEGSSRSRGSVGARQGRLRENEEKEGDAEEELVNNCNLQKGITKKKDCLKQQKLPAKVEEREKKQEETTPMFPHKGLDLFFEKVRKNVCKARKICWYV